MNDDLARLLDGLEEAIAERRPYDGPVPQGGILPTLIAELRRRDEALAAVRGLAEELTMLRPKDPTRDDMRVAVARNDIGDRLRSILAAHTEQATEATP